MERKHLVPLIIGSVALSLATGAWMLGLYGALGNPSLALHLEIALREPSALSRIRYEVYLSLGADPDRRFTEMDGMTPLDIAVERKNIHAIELLAPLAEDATFDAAMSLACKKSDDVLVRKMQLSRGDEKNKSPCSE